MKRIIAASLIAILLLSGCRSTEIKSACEALKIARDNLPAGIVSHVNAVAAEGGGTVGGREIYFVDFVGNNVSKADLGTDWTIDENNRAMYPGDTYNLLIIRIYKDTGKIVSKTATNGTIAGHPGMLPDCAP